MDKYQINGVPLTGKARKAMKKEIYGTKYKEPFISRRRWIERNMEEPAEVRERVLRKGFASFFHSDFINGHNVYSMLIDMIKAIPEKHLITLYLEEFKIWITESGEERRLQEQFLTAEVQNNALACIGDLHKRIVGDIFQISREKLEDDVQSLLQSHIAKKDFSRAAQLAIRHNLRVGFDEVVLPLVLTDETLAYKLMVGRVDLQRKLVEFLDRLVGGKNSIESIERLKNEGIPHKNLERLSGDSLDRFMKSIINRAEFDPELIKFAPKLEMHMHMKEFRYQIRQRYENGGSDVQYFQHMQCLSKLPGNIRESLLFYLWDSKRDEKRIDAISWAIYLGIDDPRSSHIPGLMKDFFRNPDGRLQEAEQLLKDRKEQCLPEVNKKIYIFEDQRKYPIHLVQTEADLMLLTSQLKHLENDVEPIYVGFDSEWTGKVERGAGKANLMQFFFREAVWMVDCVELAKSAIKVKEETWQLFAKRLFGSKKIKVIGFDLRNDLDAFLTIPALKHTLKIEDIQNTWCLKRLTENVCDIDMEILGLVKKSFKLADLTQRLLNIELDKTEQCSNWQFRPLRLKQIVYAAMDAVVVVETFKEVLKRARDSSDLLDVEKLMNESNVMAPKKEKDKRETRKFSTIPWAELYEILNSHRNLSKILQKPYDVKVIVDTMLLGFGKNLRRMGIDVMIPEDVADFRDKLSKMSRLGGEFQRKIITVPSKSFESLKMTYERQTVALDITSKPPLDQITAFLGIYNIDFCRELEFFRCTECNSRHIVKIPSPVIHFLHQYRIVYQQNAFRSMNEFPLEEWWNRLTSMDPSEYDNIEVQMSRPSPVSNWIVATVPTGCLHITRNTVIHSNLPYGVEVRIHKIPDDEFKRGGLCFFVCGECGTVHYDGREQYASHGPIIN